MENKYASVKERLLALLFDYLVILAYIVVLFVSNLLFLYLIFGGIPALGRIGKEFISFFALLFPVFLYLVITEYGRNRATLGKRKMKIYIDTHGENRLTLLQIIIRNAIKLLPWQLAHTLIFTGIHNDWQITSFMIAATIIIYGLPIISILFLVLRKDHRSLHDLIANTKVLKQ